MVVAAIVGWVAVEHMVEQAPTATEQAPMLTAPVQPVPPPAPPEVVPEEAPPADEVDENANEELAAEAEDSVQAEEVQEPVEPPVDVPEVEVVPPPPPPAPTPPPAVVERQAAAPLAPAAPVPDVFTVTFRNGSPTIDRLVVRCHKGGVGEGAEVVHIAGAGKGPCRVEGYTGSEKIAVSAILMGPQNFTCFEGNARLCR
jgi:hypothetical protein